MSCSLTDPAGCIVETLFGFILDLINMSLQPYIDTIYRLMTFPIDISAFSDVLGTIIYVLSLFYGIILIYVGFKFIISGESPAEREKAKTFLRNTIIMMILVQTSYYIYELIISISSALTSSFLNIAGNNVFIINSVTDSNIGLELIYGCMYVITLIITVNFLVLRYIFVSLGVIFFVIAIFFYFIPFLHSFGKLILNSLIMVIFLPVFYSLVFLGISRLLNTSSLDYMNLLFIIGAFSLIIIGTIFLYCFIIIKAASGVIKVAAPVIQIAKLAGGI
jgi:hypothetical protein